MLVLRISGSFSDENLEKLYRDYLLQSNNGGTKFLFDAAFPFCYQGGEPTADLVIRDIAEQHDGKFNLSADQQVGFGGNGFDFSALTATTAGSDNCNIEAPTGVWGGVFSQQHFLVCMYVKMPVVEDWNTNNNLFPIFSGSETGYQVDVDPLTIAQTSTSGINYLSFRRQTALNVVSNTNLQVGSHYGKLTQIAYWRTAAGVSARLKSVDATTITTASAGALSTLDFSNNKARFGIVPPFTNFSIDRHRAARNFKLYRGFIEDLTLSGRDPLTVLDEDFTRVVERNVFS